MITSTVGLIVSLAATAISAGMQAAGQMKAAKAAKEQQDRIAAMQRFNSQVQKNNAMIESQKAQVEAERIRRKNLLIIGAQRAGFLKSGVELSGTAEDVMYDSSIEGELDAMTALYVGAASSRAYRMKAMEASMEAESAEKTGESALELGRWQAGATILNSAAQGLSTSYSATRNPTMD